MFGRQLTINVHSIFKIAFVILLVFAIATPCFLFFEHSTQTHIALREAKNAKIAMEMLDKQYYAKDTCIYDEKQYYGLCKGAEEEIQELTGKQGTIFLQSFDMKKRQILGFTYRNKRYDVVYENDGNEEKFDVRRRRSSK